MRVTTTAFLRSLGKQGQRKPSSHNDVQKDQNPDVWGLALPCGHHPYPAWQGVPLWLSMSKDLVPSYSSSFCPDIFSLDSSSLSTSHSSIGLRLI